jgi:hypothetical protein
MPAYGHHFRLTLKRRDKDESHQREVNAGPPAYIQASDKTPRERMNCQSRTKTAARMSRHKFEVVFNQLA